MIRSFFTPLGRALGKVPPRLQFAAFLVVTVLIALTLTILSYSLYLINGTAQLDLSRPGYKQALSEVSPTDDDTYDYSANGPLDKQALDEFKAKYDVLVGKTKGYSAFDPNALSDDQLSLYNTNVVGPQ